MKNFLKNPFAFIVCIMLVALGSAMAIGATPQICPACPWHVSVDTIASHVTWYGHTGLASAAFMFLIRPKSEHTWFEIAMSFTGTMLTAGLIGRGLAMVLPISPIAASVFAFTAIVAIGVYRFFKPILTTYVEMGLLQEIWLQLLLNKLVPEGVYLTRSVDLSAYVNYNQLHYTETGDLPTVLVDNNVFPVPYAPRIDNPLQAALHYFSTLGTVVTDAEAKQLSYPKVQSVVDNHGLALWQKLVNYITYQWYPQANTAFTPITNTTGLLINSAVTYASNSDAHSYAFTPGILSAQKKIMDDLFVPEQGRVSLLSSQAMDDLSALDAVIYKRIMDNTSGKPINLYGFDVYTTQTPALYDATTNTKLALGAVGDANTRAGSLFYYEKEMYRAEGDTKMFARLNDPEAQGDIINFGKFFTGGSLRNKYCSVVVPGIKA